MEQLARSVISRLRAEGHQAWLVGGCVRDLLLNRAPKDYDVATGATPVELRRVFPGAHEVGAHFGVVLVVEGGSSVEVATFRSDLAYSDGRHPDGVRFETDPRQDALRRDFTINGLFLDPDSGDVLDFTGGRADLEAKVIRTIGDPEVRFQEDHLRMLRAVRFAAGLGFDIAETTFEAIQRMAPAIQRISMERVRDEISRILTQPNPRRGFELLDSTGLLHEVLPEIEGMKGVAQPEQFHPEGDVWVHTLLMLEGLRQPSLQLALGVLLHDVGKPATFRIAGRIRFDGHVEKGMEIGRRLLTRLKYPAAVIDAACELIANHMKFREVKVMRESTLKRFLRLPHFDEHLELHRLDCVSSHGHLDHYDFARAKAGELPAEVLRPTRLLTGQDLIAAGLSPGPKFRELLGEVEDAQLEGTIVTREEAMTLVRNRLVDPGQSPFHAASPAESQ